MPREIRTRALVLRTFDQGESDRLVHFYTEAEGRMSAIAKGARRSKRRFPGTLEIFSILDVRLVDPPRSSMLRLEGARMIAPIEGITRDLARYAIGCQLLELLDRLTGEGEAMPALYRFAVGALEVTASERPDRLFSVLLLAKVLAHLGYRPVLRRCTACGAALPDDATRVGFSPRQGGALCPDCREPEDPGLPSGLLAALERGIATPLRERAELGLRPNDIAALDGLLWRFFQFHIGFQPRSAPFLRAVLERPAAAAPLLDARSGPDDTRRAPAPDG